MSSPCENKLTIRGTKGVLECLAAIKGEPDECGPRHIDFRKIVPMPPILRTTMVGGFAWEASISLEEFDSLGDHDPPLEERERREKECERETGYRDWCAWRVGTREHDYEDGHWGTKWNAFDFAPIKDVSDTRATMTFHTPDSPPIPVIMELSWQFPTLIFTLRYWVGDHRSEIVQIKAGEIL